MPGHSPTPSPTPDIADLIFDAVKEVESQTSKPSSTLPSGGSLAGIQKAALSGRKGSFDTDIDNLFIELSAPVVPRSRGQIQLAEEADLLRGRGQFTDSTPQYPSAGIATLQEQLVLGGYLSLNTFRELEAFGGLGRPGEDTRTALRKLYKEAADNNLGPMDYLELRVQSGGFASLGGGERQRAPFVAQLTHPDDLRDVFQAAARHFIGREVEASQVDSFISNFQQQERSAQRKAYDVAETGGEVVSPSDPGTAAQGDIEQRFPAEVYGQDLRGAMEGLVAAIQGRISAEGFGA